MKIEYKIDHKKIFLCNEETNFYAHCVEDFVLLNMDFHNENIVEFGSGDGQAIVKAIVGSNYQGKITGYEINPQSIKIANQLIKENNLSGIYEINNKDFFKEEFDENSILISNPPYLPAYNNDILMPALYGGLNGYELSKKLIDLDFKKVLLLISSYCDPKGFIHYLESKDYTVTKFGTSFMEFGLYSSEDKVMERIIDMQKEEKAFFNNKGYLLAGVLLEKHSFKSSLNKELYLSLSSL